MERVKVYIDGANFFYGLKTINPKYNDFHFDFKKFCNTITKGKKLTGINYYNASLKQNKDPKLFADQQRFFAKLRKKGIKVILCKRQRRLDSNNKEYFKIKGDDIHLAVDMVAEAYENIYDVAILVSGDGDFKPAVLKVKDRDKKVKNYYFPTQASLDLTNNCDVSVPINKKLVKRHFCIFP